MSDASAIQVRAAGFDAALAALPTFEAWVEEAIRAHSKPRCGKNYISGMAFYALHKQAKAKAEEGGKGGVMGPVQSTRTNNVQITYGSVGVALLASDMGDFASTVWGRTYIEWRRKLPASHGGIIPGGF